ncbi:MAG: hypothetical protein HY763_04685 [Planctomycetes bacterium]|nr:hypothetical protein [Planctomycetota bacterium]
MTLPVVLVLFVGMLGYEEVNKSLQTRETWQGEVVRVHHGNWFFTSKRRSRRWYWDVRTTDGGVRTVRVYGAGKWPTASRGDWAVKQAGTLDPYVIRHR